ncbi:MULTISPECIES: hypothetical protein [unclassified Sphingomonas]|uniref:hypothetical protein n=1 Tax=unclassified Sphingomonas TaxID=196159 RepID=UPI001AC7CAE8|nr:MULTISPECIES: hypothetical protein [unclassified Sphingomonas]MBN8847070.1 hypothetical protein [Sphingomonas sp.]
MQAASIKPFKTASELQAELDWASLAYVADKWRLAAPGFFTSLGLKAVSDQPRPFH